MPELPDIELYVDALRSRVIGCPLQRVLLKSPFLLRTVSPTPSQLEGRQVLQVRRMGKRIVLGFDEELFAVVHLMISGRLQWKPPGSKPAGKIGLAVFDFENGSLLLTEASSKKRASLHIVQGEDALRSLAPPALEPLECTQAQFIATLKCENHTLKRTLTDPRLFSGIGNSYSDEILHAARLSPIKWTSRLSDEECIRLHDAAQNTLIVWTERLKAQFGNKWPDKVTAFRPEMAVHGRYGLPCPVCGSPVQRIAYAENECNYCATCQTEGKLLADRSLSRLLGEDWPRTLEELEERKARLG